MVGPLAPPPAAAGSESEASRFLARLPDRLARERPARPARHPLEELLRPRVEVGEPPVPVEGWFEKTADPPSLPSAGDVTFTLTLTNPDPIEPVRIDALFDDHFGDLFDREERYATLPGSFDAVTAYIAERASPRA